MAEPASWSQLERMGRRAGGEEGRSRGPRTGPRDRKTHPGSRAAQALPLSAVTSNIQVIFAKGIKMHSLLDPKIRRFGFESLIA